jgi:hypothetical protein
MPPFGNQQATFGPAGTTERTPRVYRTDTGDLTSPRLASLGSGPDRPLLGLFKFRSAKLGIWDGQHLAHFARRSGAERFASYGPIGDKLFRCCANGSGWCLVAPAGPLMPNAPQIACAGPSVRVRPQETLSPTPQRKRGKLVTAEKFCPIRNAGPSSTRYN